MRDGVGHSGPEPKDFILKQFPRSCKNLLKSRDSLLLGDAPPHILGERDLGMTR